MKKLLFLICSLLLILCAFSACNGEKAPESAPVNSSSQENSNDTADFTSIHTPETQPPEYSEEKRIASGRVLASDLGMQVLEFKNSNPLAVEIVIHSNVLFFYGYTPGTAVFALTDHFGHTAKITATVTEGKEDIDFSIEECKDDFISVTAFGAKGNGTADDSKAFQNAIDSAKPGETVYVYPGIYKAPRIIMREGVTLKLYSPPIDAKEGYTDEIKAAIDESKYAIIINPHILNNDYGDKGAGGCSDFSIIGGVISQAPRLIFACAENIKIENVIFKDSNGHAIQIMGCKNTVIENCMFAGWKLNASLYNEVIQIEPSRPNATGGPLTFKEGEFYYSENITINNCYFGKSDTSGPPTIAVGDHCSVGGPTVTGFKITNNIFDCCLYASIRYNNTNDLEITGNTFISSSEYKKPTQYSDGTTPSFILLYHSNNKTTYTAANGSLITEKTAAEQNGLHNVKIENNTFNVGNNSDKRIVYLSNYTYAPGTSFVTLMRQEEYYSPAQEISGYSVTNNYAENISFSNNVINFKGQPTYYNYFLKLDKVYNLKIENNEIVLNDGVYFSYEEKDGMYFSSTNLEHKQTYLIETKKNNKTITINFNGKSYKISASFAGTVTLNKDYGGYIYAKNDNEGNLFIDILPTDGYSCKTIKLAGQELSPDTTITSSSTIFITFKEN